MVHRNGVSVRFTVDNTRIALLYTSNKVHFALISIYFTPYLPNLRCVHLYKSKFIFIKPQLLYYAIYKSNLQKFIFTLLNLDSCTGKSIFLPL